MTLREAGLDDAPVVADLLTQLGYPQGPDDARSRLGSWIGAERARLLLAVEGSDVIGLAAVAAVPYLERAGSWARIVALAVDGSHRRRGVGRRLVAAAEGWARQWGCVTIEVSSRRTRPESHGFYRSLGYEDRCERSAHYRREL